MQLFWLPMLLLIVGWTSVNHFSGVSPCKFNIHRLHSIQNSAARIVTNLRKYTRITAVLRKLYWLSILLAPYSLRVQTGWCTSLFILVSLNILLHIYTHTTLLIILDTVRMLPISSMYQNLNLQFTSPLSSFASVLPLMHPLFGIHFLKTFVQYPLLPLLERSSKPICTQRHIRLSSFLLWLLRGADLFLSLDFEFAYYYCLVAP